MAGKRAGEGAGHCGGRKRNTVAGARSRRPVERVLLFVFSILYCRRKMSDTEDADSPSEEKESRFAHLLQPLRFVIPQSRFSNPLFRSRSCVSFSDHALLFSNRNLADNWSIDIASELEEYLHELETITFSIDGVGQTLNFAEGMSCFSCSRFLFAGCRCVLFFFHTKSSGSAHSRVNVHLLQEGRVPPHALVPDIGLLDCEKVCVPFLMYFLCSLHS